MPPKQRLCPDCHQPFKGKSNLKAHLQRAGHGLLCPVSGCDDRRWANRSMVMQHCKAVHRVNAEPVRHLGDRTSRGKPAPKVTTRPTNTISKCPLCLLSCYDIPTHFQHSHPAFICELCELLFDSESQRHQHLCHSVPSASELPEPSTGVGSGSNEPMDSNIPFFADSDSEVGTETKNSSGRDWSREKHIPPPNPVRTPKYGDDEGINVTTLAPTFVDVLIAYFVHDFQNKHGKDPTEYKRAMRRLRIGAERVQTTLLSAPHACLQIHSLFEGVSFFCVVTRDTFEDLQVPPKQSRSSTQTEAHQDATLTAEGIDSPSLATVEHEYVSEPRIAAATSLGAAINDSTSAATCEHQPSEDSQGASENPASLVSDCDVRSELDDVQSISGDSSLFSSRQAYEELCSSLSNTRPPPLGLDTHVSTAPSIDEDSQCSASGWEEEEDLTTCEDAAPPSVDVLIAHCICRFKDKYRIDPSSDEKALHLLRAACEDAQKQLAGSPYASINIKKLFHGLHFVTLLVRSHFEERDARSVALNIHFKSGPMLDMSDSEESDSTAETTSGSRMARDVNEDTHIHVETQQQEPSMPFKFAQEMASLHGDLHPPEIGPVTNDCITPRIEIQKDYSVVDDDSPRVSLDDHSAQLAVGPRAYDWVMASDAGQDTDNLDGSLDCGKFSEVEDESATTAAEDRAALVDLASHPTALLDVNPRRTTNAGFPGPSLPNVDPFAQTSGLSEVPFNDTNRCNVRGTSTSFEQRAPVPSPTMSRIICKVCSCEPNRPTTTMCGHVFCRGCIISEMWQNLKCPVCHTVILASLNLD